MLQFPKAQYMDLTKWTEKASGLLDKLKEKFSNISSGVHSLSDRYLERFPEEKRQPILMGIGGAAVLLLVIIIVALANTSGKSKKDSAPEITAVFSIPPEQLFIPAEPDFLPDYLLEREPRSYWTIEDIRPYWKSPGNYELWQGEIKNAVDKLMEGVR